MSHIVEIKTEIRDEVAVQLACGRLGLPAATRGTFQLYSAKATGLGIELPDWVYPVVADTETGQLQIRQFRGALGAAGASRRVPAGLCRRAGQSGGTTPWALRHRAAFGEWCDQVDDRDGRCRMKRTIEIVIDAQGNTRAETKGFTGSDCLAASRFVEEALGQKVSDQKTATFYQSTSQQSATVDQKSF